MPPVSILIKPASANCNMDCKYCFYKCLSSNRKEYSKGFMCEDTLESLVKNAFDYAEGLVSFAFQGGEPTLIGMEFFKKLLELEKKYNYRHMKVENTIQTNGLLIDDEWARFLKENNFLVGLSLDGPKKIHDRYRTDVQGKPTFTRVINAAGLFNKYGTQYNIVSVITEEAAKKASYLYKFYRRNNFHFVQMIPCMDEKKRQRKLHTSKKSALRMKENWTDDSEFAVRPESYGRFLCEMFDLWYTDFFEDVKYGRQPTDIRMFSNLAQMALGYPPEECGMCGHCSCYFVAEGDGSVYPCDFYCVDDWKLGTVDESFSDMIKSEKADIFVKQSLPVLEECRICEYYNLCRGGCRRWREKNDASLGKNSLCEGYKIFFEHTCERIERLGDFLKCTHLSRQNL